MQNMKDSKVKDNFFSLILKEVDAYSSIDSIENLIESGGDLSHIPVQPLYMSIRQLSSEQAAEYLPRLSKEQRKVFRELDLWNKDKIDIQRFNYWIKSYALCKDSDIQFELSESKEFFLYLKMTFRIYPFDVEEPTYPNHDNFFITDDNQLLLEFDKEFDCVSEVKQIVDRLYSNLGVEKAYSYIYRIFFDSGLILLEDEYEYKKGLLRDYGFIDYFDALEINSTWSKLSLLDNFIVSKVRTSVTVSEESQNQVCDRSSIQPYREYLDIFEKELGHIKDTNRISFLKFNFIILVNAIITLDDSHGKGSIAISKSGSRASKLMMLGFDYLKNFSNERPKSFPTKKISGESVFSYFDFTELFRIGNTLIKINQIYIKNQMTKTGFKEEDESFIGKTWSDFLENSYNDIPKLQDSDEVKLQDIDNYTTYNKWLSKSESFVSMLPFIKKMQLSFNKFVSNFSINNNYYHNYNVESIDFEALIINVFAVFCLKISDNKKKLGLTIKEYKEFIKIVIKDDSLIKSSLIDNLINDFAKKFGFNDILYFDSYFYNILKYNMEGYQFSKLSDEEFQYVGGPIILKI